MRKTEDRDQSPRKTYEEPRLTKLGRIEDLTAVGGTPFGETGSSPKNPKASSLL